MRTARSTSGGIVTSGKHVIKTYCRQQKVVALSSAEAELYAMVAASAETLAAIAYAKDLGSKVGGEVYTDSSAALEITQRAGIGKVRHLRTQGLWVQETRLTGRLGFKKVLGQKNPADILTKHVARDLLDRHLATMGTEFKDGRAETAPELNSVESAVEWYIKDDTTNTENEPNAKKRTVKFASRVKFIAIPQENRGRRCCDRKAGRTIRRPRWADMED